MNQSDSNVQLVEGLVRHLAELTDEFVLVGGCATGLLITDPARPPVRVTKDVDLITSVATHNEYYELAARLRALGFSEDQSSDVLCRWNIGEYLVDIMPTDETILGFSNHWYSEAISTAATFTLPSHQKIRLITAPLFVATKLAAFSDRGNEDYGMSHDMEDIVTIVDGRSELVGEIDSASPQAREFIRNEIEDLLERPEFVDSLNWHLAGDSANQERVPMIIERLRRIATI